LVNRWKGNRLFLDCGINIDLVQVSAGKMATPLGGICHLLKELFSTTSVMAFPESGHAAGVDRQLVLKVYKIIKYGR